MLYLVYLGSGIKGILDGELFGIATRTWFIISIITAFAHQTYVWFCWRMQLHLGFITKLMPKTGFYVYAAGFFLLFFARMAVVLLLAISNRGSLGFNSLILYILAAIVTVPAVYAFYSVYKYFGLLRATGQDHFDETYRSLPFEKRGMFKYSKNAMYTYALLILLVPGLLFNSSAGLLLAIFNYTYVWIHYYTLELPDIRRMYG